MRYFERWRKVIKPTKKINYIKTLGAALKTINAERSDQYSWIAKTEESFVFTAEIDHKDRENNIYKHMEGTFHKKVRPISKELGDKHQTIRHAVELYEAINEAFEKELKCNLVLVKGTMYGTYEGEIKAAIDGDYWKVKEFSGNVAEGFQFLLVRVE